MQKMKGKDTKQKGKKLPKSPSSSEANTQKKITQFFKKEELPCQSAQESNQPAIVESPYFNNDNEPKQCSSASCVTKTSVIVNKSENRTQKDEVITLSDSESDSTPISPSGRISINLLKSIEVHVDGTCLNNKIDLNEKVEGSISSEVVLKDDDLKSVFKSKTENKCGEEKLSETDSSGEEFLSQIDMDEIIRCQQKFENENQVKLIAASSEYKIPEKKDCKSPVRSADRHRSYKSPTKSPKPKINHFSPLRHMNKRSHSKSSSDGGSPYRPNRQSSTSPFRKQQSKSPTVKKLQFNVDPSVPYFLKNFKSVIDSVVHNEHHSYLLNEEDWKTVDNFDKLSFDARCLYVRLFLRKWGWKVASTIKYPKIKEDLIPVFEELHSSGFLVEITDDKLELEDVLDLLNGEQIVTLAKQMRVDPSKKTKEHCKRALMNLTKNQKTLHGSSSDILVKSCLKLLGLTYKLESNTKNTFSRLFILYSPPMYWEDEMDQTSNQLLKILMADDGRMEYPDCVINKSVRIYPDRKSLVSFYDAWTMHSDISSHLESKNWTDVIQIGKEAVSQLKETLENTTVLSHDSNLPSFLRVYTTGSILTRISWLSVEGCQKLKKYDSANSTLEFLLNQEMYLQHYRGRWHDRMAINSKHLKIPLVMQKCTIEKALSDRFIQDSYKLLLSDRLEKLYEDCNKPQRKKLKNSKKEKQNSVLEEQSVENRIELFRLKNNIPTRSIEGEKLDYTTGKSVFIGERDSYGTSQASSVELFAIEFYKDIGFKYVWGMGILTNEEVFIVTNMQRLFRLRRLTLWGAGLQSSFYRIHAEGTVVVSIYGLLFWDEIYNSEISDTFHTPYQAFPLDMNFDDFYKRREEIFLTKFKLLRTEWTVDDAFLIMKSNWEKHFNKLCIINWSVFPSIERAQSLVKAMGLSITTSLCERLSMNFRHCRSGFPDLVVWNDDEENFIFVEVKGPNDSLSPKQMLWIDFLISIGAKAEVCHVVAVSNKRIKVVKK